MKNKKALSWLEKSLLVSWYITVGSAAFGPYLLRIPLPIGGHFFLFRGAILTTCLIYFLILFYRRENPFLGFSKIELCFLGVAVCMLGYGLISVAWAISLEAWFSKFFTMCQMFALVFLFLKLCRNEQVMCITLLLIGVVTLFCAIGGFIECFHGPFFNTSCGQYYSYGFFGKGIYPPIFTFYNPNNMAAYLLFVLESLYLHMAFYWERTGLRQNKYSLYIFSVGMMFTLFLCCADSARLAIISIPFILCGLAIWLAIRYKNGLIVFIWFALYFLFIYAGENHGTLYTIVPSVTGTIDNASIKASDGIRLTLLKNSLKMLLESNGLGIGLGNAELCMQKINNTSGIFNVHCFIMEVFLEFGVFALIPLLVLLFMVLKVFWANLYTGWKLHNQEQISNILFMLFTIIAFPFLSTASASSWGIVSMWLYLAQILLYSGEMEQIKKSSIYKKDYITL